jgi:hypothetical protein
VQHFWCRHFVCGLTLRTCDANAKAVLEVCRRFVLNCKAYHLVLLLGAIYTNLDYIDLKVDIQISKKEVLLPSGGRVSLACRFANMRSHVSVMYQADARPS